MLSQDILALRRQVIMNDVWNEILNYSEVNLSGSGQFYGSNMFQVDPIGSMDLEQF
jgi:hypothetical protein